jgi:hypothetical protein
MPRVPGGSWGVERFLMGELPMKSVVVLAHEGSDYSYVVAVYRNTSPLGNHPPHWDPHKALAWAYCRVLGEGVFMKARYPCRSRSWSYRAFAEGVAWWAWWFRSEIQGCLAHENHPPPRTTIGVPRSSGTTPPRTAVGPHAYAYCRVLGDGDFYE